MRREWESAKLIWQTMGFAATLTLLSASRVSSSDQWLYILSQWAVMMFVVVIGRVGWVICIQIAEETKRVLHEQKVKEADRNEVAGWLDRTGNYSAHEQKVTEPNEIP